MNKLPRNFLFVLFFICLSGFWFFVGLSCNRGALDLYPDSMKEISSFISKTTQNIFWICVKDDNGYLHIRSRFGISNGPDLILPPER